MIVILAGLPATGKSALAAVLARLIPCAILDKDVIRAALFPPFYVAYTAEQDDFCQEIMQQTAAYLLGKDPTLCIVLDGRTFSRRYQRQRVIDFCAQIQASWAIIECVCDEQIALERLAKDIAHCTHLAANRTPELYRQVRDSWEPIDVPKLVVHTDAELDTAALLLYIRANRD